MNAIALETGGFGKASGALSPHGERGGRIVQGRLGKLLALKTLLRVRSSQGLSRHSEHGTAHLLAPEQITNGLDGLDPQVVAIGRGADEGFESHRHTVERVAIFR